MNCYPKLLLLSISLFAAVTHAQKLVYQKILDKDTTESTVTISQSNNGFTYYIESISATGKITELAEVNSDGLTRAWDYSNPGEKLTVKCNLENGQIALKAHRKGKDVSKVLKPQHPWLQIFPHDLSSFVQSSDDTLILEAIGLFGPGALKIGKMQAVKLGDESVSVNGTQQTCLHVRVGLTGIFARLWHADYWFRKSDGRFLKGIWVEKTGADPSTTELIQEH